MRHLFSWLFAASLHSLARHLHSKLIRGLNLFLQWGRFECGCRLSYAAGPMAGTSAGRSSHPDHSIRTVWPKRMVSLVKKALCQTSSGTVLTKGELDAHLAEAADIINSRPLGMRAGHSDLCDLLPLTPNHILLGRARTAAPKDDESRALWSQRRLAFMAELSSQFWAKRIDRVLPNLLATNRWAKVRRNLQINDVVLIKYESKKGQTHKTGSDHRRQSGSRRAGAFY